MPALSEGAHWEGSVVDAEAQCCADQCQGKDASGRGTAAFAGGAAYGESSSGVCTVEGCSGDALWERKEHDSGVARFLRRLRVGGAASSVALGLTKAAGYEPVAATAAGGSSSGVSPLGDGSCRQGGVGDADAAPGLRGQSSAVGAVSGYGFPLGDVGVVAAAGGGGSYVTAGGGGGGYGVASGSGIGGVSLVPMSLSPNCGGSPCYHLSRSVSTETMIVEGLSVDMGPGKDISPPISAMTAARSAWGSSAAALRQPVAATEQQEPDGVSALLPGAPRKGFKVLGVEISNWSETQQYLYCAGGIFAFLLVYGYLQEYLVVQVFERQLGLFLTLLQFGGYTAYAFLQRLYHNDMHRAVPARYYALLSLMQAAMQGLTNVSMTYLNYPAKVLFKSSRVVPTMFFGIIYQGRRYTRKDYMVVVLIVTGLVVFMEADAASSPAFDIRGVLLISVALLIDAAIINIQEEVMSVYDSNHDELILYSYLGGTAIVFASNLWTGELWEGAAFLKERGWNAVLVVMLFAGAGFLGVSCVAALTKRFGALVCAITTTARKAATLLLSFCFFPKPLTAGHLCGVALFIAGLLVKSVRRRTGSNGCTGPSNSGALALPKVKLASGISLPIDGGTRNVVGSPERDGHLRHRSTHVNVKGSSGGGGAGGSGAGLATGVCLRDSYNTYSTVCGDVGSPAQAQDTTMPMHDCGGGSAAVAGGSGSVASGDLFLPAPPLPLPRPAGHLALGMAMDLGSSSGAAVAKNKCAVSNSGSESAAFMATPPVSVLMM